MLKKMFLAMIIILTFIIFTSCNVKKENNKIDGLSHITVAIPPVKSFVEWIGGDKITVESLIPPGSSPVNYQLKSSQIKDLVGSSLYFSIGVPAEKSSILDQIKSNAKKTKVVVLNELVAKEFNVLYFDEHEKGEADPHIWLSPKRVLFMLDIIHNELAATFPKHKDTFSSNLRIYKETLNDLDKKIEAEISKLKSKQFILFHPSYGYFANDYGLTMVALEEHGKEASATRFKEVVNFAKSNNIKTIFYQAEIDSSQAETLAMEIGGKAEMIDPLSLDYFNSFEKILGLLKEVNDYK